jgi:hypothetical protein
MHTHIYIHTHTAYYSRRYVPIATGAWNLKAKTASEIAARDQALHTVQQKYCKEKRTANVDCNAWKERN